MKKSSIIIATLLLGVSCSKVQDSTKNIERSTHESTQVANDSLFLERAKSSEDTRSNKKNILLNSKSNLGDKMRAAEVYFKNFEFQLLTDKEFDDQDTRNSFYLDAVNEFTAWVSDIYRSVKPSKMSPLNEGKESEDSLYAISIALHANHLQQEKLAKKRGQEPVSFLEIIKRALKKDMLHEELLDYEEVLVNGINKEIMVELIKARMDMMANLALKNLTDSREMDLTQKSKKAIYKITGGRFSGIDVPEVYDVSNDATKSFTGRYLDASIRAKLFLREVGAQKVLDKSLKSAFSNIDFNESKMTADQKSEVDEKKDKIRYLINTLLDTSENGEASYVYIL